MDSLALLTASGRAVIHTTWTELRHLTTLAVVRAMVPYLETLICHM